MGHRDMVTTSIIGEAASAVNGLRDAHAADVARRAVVRRAVVVGLVCAAHVAHRHGVPLGSVTVRSVIVPIVRAFLAPLPSRSAIGVVRGEVFGLGPASGSGADLSRSVIAGVVCARHVAAGLGVPREAVRPVLEACVSAVRDDDTVEDLSAALASGWWAVRERS